MTTMSIGYATDTFEAFVERALPRLVRFATWVGGPTGDPEDLVQDALERVGLKWRSISGGQDQAEAYVRRAIVNGHVSRWRARRREHLVEAVPDRAVAGTGTGVGDPRQSEVWHAVMELPRRQRAVIVLRFFEELSVAETAQALGLAEGTVKAHTHRALESLRTSLHLAGHADAAISVAASAGPLLVTAPGAGREMSEAVASRRRRRNVAIVGGVTAAVVAAILVVSIGWPLGRIDRVQPVIPAPSVEATTPTVQTETGPSSSAAIPFPASPTPGGAGGSSASASGGAATASVDLTTYRLSLEDTGPTDAGGVTRDGATGWPVDPCQPTTYPTDAQQLDFISASYYLGDAGESSYIARYPDEATASDVLAGFVRAAEACGRVDEPRPAEGSGVTQWSLPQAPAIGDEAVALSTTEYVSDFGLPGSDVVAVRVDSYVVLALGDSLYAGSLSDEQRLAGVVELAVAETQRLEAAIAAGA